MPDRGELAALDDGWLSDLLGRADAAYQTEWARWQTIIDGLQKDRGLNADQRAAAVIALRQRQRLEAKAARRRLINEERTPRRIDRKMRPALASTL